jgi:alpha-N-acetylglucosamine transferase
MMLVQNSQILPIKSLAEALQAFERGVRTRRVEATSMNDASSRSHLIFTILIDTLNLETKQSTKSKLSFVDLAGSERLDKVESDPIERQGEGIKINQSLLVLG